MKYRAARLAIMLVVVRSFCFVGDGFFVCRIVRVIRIMKAIIPAMEFGIPRVVLYSEFWTTPHEESSWQI